MTRINPLNDAESKRLQRNMTTSQKKTNLSVKEGVIVNTFVKDRENYNLSDTYNNLLISDNVELPEKIYESDKKKTGGIKPIAILTLGVMTAVAVISAFVKRNAKIATDLAKEKWLPTVTRNVSLNEETTQAIYQMIQNPNRRTIIAGTGVLGLTAMAFMGKTFLDGYKDIWVKRKEADIQKNLQENLISVETQSFGGKMQIIRNMLSKYAGDFEKYLDNDSEKILPHFGRHDFSKIPFTSAKSENTEKKDAAGVILLGIGAISAIIGLGYFAIKNAAKSRQLLQKYLNDTKLAIQNLAKTSTEKTKSTDMENLENMFKIVDATPEYIEKVMKDVNWSEAEKKGFIDKVVQTIKTSTTKVNPTIGGDGTPKPTFYSFVDDYRAFFYNWLLDPSNPQFKQLFFGITGVTAAGYSGKLVGDAIKDVQVKKINAETELDLQKRLVSTELRNFKAKKDAAIQPIVDEFYKQVDNGKSKAELKTMAENILFEVKNGAPFVYS